MRKGYLKDNWRKLDNTAKIFSLDSRNNINIFRYSIILKEDVSYELLVSSVKMALNKMIAFKVKLETGFFWNYLEYNNKEPVILEDNGIPCKHINLKNNNDYLFKVTYYNKTINLDIHHVLTDGTGAINFLKLILYSYLDLKYKLNDVSDNLDGDVKYNDQYLMCYDKKILSKGDLKRAYQIPGKISSKINYTNHYKIDVSKLKSICRKYNITITEYLTAVYIYALYLSFYNKKEKRDIAIHVPINLRKIYLVDTPSNFFVCMNIRFNVSDFKVVTFKNILREVKNDFRNKLNNDKVKEYLNRDVKLGMNIPIRLIPLPIKKFFIRFIGNLFLKSSTSTLSNIGIIKIDDCYRKYVDNVLIMVRPGKYQKIKCTVCSFDNWLNVVINANVMDKVFNRNFYKLLKKDLGDIVYRKELS